MLWTFLFIFHGMGAGAAPSALTYQGRILKADGTPLEHTSVSFQFEILNDSGSCVLYREQVNGINMANSHGVFDVKIGASHSFPADSGFDILKSFNNSTPFLCDGGAAYNPSSNEGRRLRVQFYDGTAWKRISPDSLVRSVPYAAYADSAVRVGGHEASEFV